RGRDGLQYNATPPRRDRVRLVRRSRGQARERVPATRIRWWSDGIFLPFDGPPFPEYGDGARHVRCPTRQIACCDTTSLPAPHIRKVIAPCVPDRRIHAA